MNNKGADQTAQAGLCLFCSQTPEDRFSRDWAHVIISSKGSGETVLNVQARLSLGCLQM